jgi:hypothetical protein
VRTLLGNVNHILTKFNVTWMQELNEANVNNLQADWGRVFAAGAAGAIAGAAGA